MDPSTLRSEHSWTESSLEAPEVKAVLAVTDLSAKDATDLFTKQTTAINSLWQNYSAVAGVMLIGAGISAVGHPLTWQPKLALSLAFVMFSQGNFILLRQACRLHVVLQRAIQAKLKPDADPIAPVYREVLGTFASTANSPTWMMLYHLTIDGCVVAAIWWSSALFN